MSAALNVAIVGATGAVGQEFLTVLADRDFPVKNLKLLASARSGMPDQPSKPIVSRFERPFAPAQGGGGAGAAAPVALPVPLRTIGSKIPINRRQKRRR